MAVTTLAPVTETLTIPTSLPAAEAIARLRAIESTYRDNPHWLVPMTIAADWTETGATIRGSAFAFAIEGTVAAAEDAVTVTLTVPWLAKGFAGNYLPRLQKALGEILA